MSDDFLSAAAADELYPGFLSTLRQCAGADAWADFPPERIFEARQGQALAEAWLRLTEVGGLRHVYTSPPAPALIVQALLMGRYEDERVTLFSLFTSYSELESLARRVSAAASHDDARLNAAAVAEEARLRRESITAVETADSRFEHRLHSIETESAVLLQEARVAVREAQRAAGVTGQEALQNAFEQYEKTEREAANRYRWGTIVGLGAVIAIGALSFVMPDWPSAAAPDDWHSVAYRLAVIAGIGALAAYLGRQSGAHRRNAVWAKSIAVQLQSFRAFVDPIEVEDVKVAMYQTFGRRVLGAPPEPNAKANDDAASPLVAQLIETVLRLQAK